MVFTKLETKFNSNSKSQMKLARKFKLTTLEKLWNCVYSLLCMVNDLSTMGDAFRQQQQFKLVDIWRKPFIFLEKFSVRKFDSSKFILGYSTQGLDTLRTVPIFNAVVHSGTLRCVLVRSSALRCALVQCVQGRSFFWVSTPWLNPEI